VTVPDGHPKPVTFIYPYFDNPLFLRRQIDQWLAYGERLHSWIRFIVVDDASPTTSAEDVVKHLSLPFNLRVFRIGRNVRWNWLAARNIGAHHAEDGWILLTDMDHMVPLATAESAVYGAHDPEIAYAFSRVEHFGEVVAPHSASWLMTKALFWQVGGYDERLSGHYGTDGMYRRRLMASAPAVVLRNRLVRYEYVEDASTPREQQQKIEDAAKLKAIVASLPAHSAPRTLSFPYREVAL
jgi:glycosyltransferase involved in cell wall biosynthesis